MLVMLLITFNYLKLTDDRFKDENWSPKINISLDEDDKSLTVGYLKGVE